MDNGEVLGWLEVETTMIFHIPSFLMILHQAPPPRRCFCESILSLSPPYVRREHRMNSTRRKTSGLDSDLQHWCPWGKKPSWLCCEKAEPAAALWYHGGDITDVREDEADTSGDFWRKWGQVIEHDPSATEMEWAVTTSMSWAGSEKEIILVEKDRLSYLRPWERKDFSNMDPVENNKFCYLAMYDGKLILQPQMLWKITEPLTLEK